MSPPNFENDVFISYTHIDNTPLCNDQKGWIDVFHSILEIRLNQLMYRDSKVWRDKKLQGNDVFDEAIVRQISKAALLVLILSPRYVSSEWCVKERRKFIQAAEETGGVCFQEKSRIYKVVKTPVPYTEQPPELRSLLGYEFYDIPEQCSHAKEFAINPHDESFKKFLGKIDDLSYNLRDVLKNIHPTSRDLAGETIYLASTVSDLKPQRDEIRRLLQHQGHIVLPDEPLPLTARELDEAIRENLRRCKLSIHLIGKNASSAPGGYRSIDHLQVELALLYAQDRPFKQIIWLPKGLKIAGTYEHQEFLAYLRTHVADQGGVELVEDNLEELKTVIKDKLTTKKIQEPLNHNGRLRIYLMCHKKDISDVPEIQHLLKERYEIILPAMEGEDAKVHDDHKDKLKWCDAAMIYYGRGNEPWFWTKISDLKKASGYRKKDWLGKLVYIGPPKTPPKNTFIFRDGRLIRDYESFKPDLIRPWLDRLTIEQDHEEQQDDEGK